MRKVMTLKYVCKFDFSISPIRLKSLPFRWKFTNFVVRITVSLNKTGKLTMSTVRSDVLWVFCSPSRRRCQSAWGADPPASGPARSTPDRPRAPSGLDRSSPSTWARTVALLPAGDTGDRQRPGWVRTTLGCLIHKPGVQERPFTLKWGGLSSLIFHNWPFVVQNKWINTICLCETLQVLKLWWRSHSRWWCCIQEILK